MDVEAERPRVAQRARSKSGVVQMCRVSRHLRPHRRKIQELGISAFRRGPTRPLSRWQRRTWRLPCIGSTAHRAARPPGADWQPFANHTEDFSSTKGCMLRERSCVVVQASSRTVVLDPLHESRPRVGRTKLVSLGHVRRPSRWKVLSGFLHGLGLVLESPRVFPLG